MTALLLIMAHSTSMASDKSGYRKHAAFCLLLGEGKAHTCDNACSQQRRAAEAIMRTVVVAFVFALFASTLTATSPQKRTTTSPHEYVSVIQLIANPSSFDGKRVVIFGFMWPTY